MITIGMRIFIMLTTISMLEIQLDSLKFALTIGISRAGRIRIGVRNQNLNFFFKVFGILQRFFQHDFEP